MLQVIASLGLAALLKWNPRPADKTRMLAGDGDVSPEWSSGVVGFGKKV